MKKLGDTKKKYLLFLPLAILLTITSILAFNSVSKDSISATPGNVKYESIWCYSVDRANGDYENLGCSHNVVTNGGLEAIEESLLGKLNHTFTTIALCNNTVGYCATPAAAESETFREMSGCGLTPNSTTVKGSNAASNGNWTILASFVSGCNGVIVNVTKLRDANGQVNLSSNYFTDTTLNNGDTLSINTTLFLTSG